ncbi:hypothetical protein HUJ04_006075 [Dendroctonus ponderosae]|nr:hypothetical protein HUJ04_006075 [Dendroctonus ponderosae]
MAMKKSSIWNSIADNTKYSVSISSISGVSYICNNGKRSLIERIFWIGMVICMIILAAWQGLSVYTHYKERPVIVTVDNAYFEWKFEFPTATICSVDLKPDSQLRTIIEKLNLQLLGSEYADFINYLQDLAFKNYMSYHEYKEYSARIKREFLHPDQYMEVLDEVTLNIAETTGKPAINFPMKQVRPVLRVFTEWGPCMVANPNVSIYFTPKYFNSSNLYADYQPIVFTVNDLTSFLFQKPNSTKGVSHIYFHAPNEVMEIMDRKDTLPHQRFLTSKYEADVVQTSQNVLPLTVEQKNCRLPLDYGEEPLLHSPVYSYNLCKFECRIKIALKYCNCTPYYYRRLAHEPICNLSGLYCLSKYKTQLIYARDSSIECPNCLQNCDVYVFRGYETALPYTFLQTTLDTGIIFPNIVYIRNLVYSKIDLTEKSSLCFKRHRILSFTGFGHAGFEIRVSRRDQVLQKIVTSKPTHGET